MVAVAALLAGFQLHEYRSLMDEAAERTLGRASLAAEWVASVFSLSDMALDGLEELSAVPLVVSLADSVDPDYETLERILAERRDRFTFLDELGLFDAQGRVVVTSSSLFPRGYDLGGLAHYRIFREQPALQEWVTGLYWSSFARDFRIIHVRRLDAGGELPAKLAATMLTPQVFDDALARLPRARGESLALLDADHQLVARRPDCLDPGICATIGELVEKPGARDVITGEVPQREARTTSPLDGVERFYATVPVEGWPFVVTAGESVAVLLEGWWQQLWVRASILLLITLLGAGMLRHYLSRLSLEQEARIAATAFESQQGMLVTDEKRRILRVNSAFTRITGYAEREVLGRMPNLLASGQHDEDFYRQMWQTIEQMGSWEGEVWNRRRNGELYPEHLLVSAVKGAHGQVTHYVGALSDISRQKAAEEEAQHLAFFDPLTGLPNRRHLLDNLVKLVDDARPGGHFGALLLVDLDHFKRVNDLLGHQRGDEVLQRITRELGQQLRDTDTLSRLSGDEFAVLLAGLGPDQEHAVYITERIATKLLGVLQVVLSGDQHAVQVTASIGITLFQLHQANPQTVLQHGDLALEQAKREGRNRFCFFDPMQQQLLRGRLRLEADLREALPKHQFRLHYQRQVDVSGTTFGAEVLLRWEHPDRGMVSPADFIPLAEESRQIIAIDHWVLETACRQLAAWARRSETRALILAVNISTLQFEEADFVDQVRQILESTGAPPERLKIEVTEGLFLERPEEALEKMLALKALGLTFALDDFGTGFSSLSYLNRLPLDQLKIDQSFVREVLGDPASAAIVASTISLAHSLELEVIAEGVETEAQRAWLEKHGCRRFQGYLFGRPLPLEGMEQALRRDAFSS